MIERLTGSAGGARARFLPALGLVLLALALTTHGALAGISWCRTDPIVRINGERVNIFVNSDEAILKQATGPTQVVVTVPLGVSTELIATDPGFGFGEVVSFTTSPYLRVTDSGRVNVVVSAYVPAVGPSLPVQVEVVPASGTATTLQGATNQWISLATRI